MEPVIRAAILAIIRGGATDSIDTTSSRFAATTLCAVAAAVLAMAAMGCAAAALWMWGVPHLGAIGASLVVSATLAAACLTVLAAMKHLRTHSETAQPSGGTPALLLAEAGRLFKDHKGAILTAALLAGLAAERRDREK
jgi:hypothetical protein